MFVSIYSLASKGYNKLLLFIFSDTIVHMHSKRHLHLPVYSDPKSHLENIYLENFPPFFSHVSPHRLTTGPTPDLISIPSTVTCLKIIFFVSGGSKETLAKFDLYYFAVCEHFQSDHHEHRQREANLEMQVETLVFSEMHGKFWYWDMFQSAMILDRKLWLRKMPIGRIFRVQTTTAWSTVEIRACSLDFVLWRE